MNENKQGSDPSHEVYISVDVETSGPTPGEYSLLSMGACAVNDDSQTFECLVKPISDKADPKALSITGFSLEELRSDGTDPIEAMRLFGDWVKKTSENGTAVFVGLNAGFDWSFINYYFHTYTGTNPFGFAPLDIKSLYMGATGCSWHDTRSSRMVAELNPRNTGNHNALTDARAQAELFRLILLRIKNSAK